MLELHVHPHPELLEIKRGGTQSTPIRSPAARASSGVVLSGELGAADGDYRTAFERYQQLLCPYVAKGQKQARGGKDFLAPPTAKKIAQLQRFYKMLPYLPVKGLMKYLTTRTATGIKLPAYSPAETTPSGRMAH
jgi:hypothetical protein